jgi:hypothetical protein
MKFTDLKEGMTIFYRKGKKESKYLPGESTFRVIKLSDGEYDKLVSLSGVDHDGIYLISKRFFEEKFSEYCTLNTQILEYEIY